jgi:competence protein ComFC
VPPVSGSSRKRVVGGVVLPSFGQLQVTPKPYFPTTRDRPATYVRKIYDGLLNLIYPETCFLCSVPVVRQQDCGICDNCWQKVISYKILPPRCSSCGLPFYSFEENSDHLCGNCIKEMPPYAGARSFGHYSAEMSRVIQELKFGGRQNLVGLLAPLLADAFFDTWSRGEVDLIVPIPLHPKRKRDRGYNQAELLAVSLSRLIAIPYCKALQRIRSTLPQVGLTNSQRLENVRKAFRCYRPQHIFKRRILLIDDVMTTGATVESAAQVLVDAGAWRVSVLTVARAGK